MNKKKTREIVIGIVIVLLLIAMVKVIPLPPQLSTGDILSASTSNIIKNPSFEEGALYWNFYSNASAVFLTNATGQTSPHAAHIIINTPSTNIQLSQYGLQLEPNTNYTLTFKGYSNTGHDADISIIKHTTPYTSYGLRNYHISLNRTWSSYLLTFRTSGFSNIVNDTRLMFWIAPYSAAGDHYYFDDIVLTKDLSIAPAPTPIPVPVPNVNLVVTINGTGGKVEVFKNTSIGTTITSRTYNVKSGSQLKIIAIPSSGYVFNRWVTNANVTITTNPLIVTQRYNGSLTAYFQPQVATTPTPTPTSVITSTPTSTPTSTVTPTPTVTVIPTPTPTNNEFDWLQYIYDIIMRIVNMFRDKP